MKNKNVFILGLGSLLFTAYPALASDAATSRTKNFDEKTIDPIKTQIQKNIESLQPPSVIVFNNIDAYERQMEESTKFICDTIKRHRKNKLQPLEEIMANPASFWFAVREETPTAIKLMAKQIVSNEQMITHIESSIKKIDAIQDIDQLQNSISAINKYQQSIANDWELFHEKFRNKVQELTKIEQEIKQKKDYYKKSFILDLEKKKKQCENDVSICKNVALLLRKNMENLKEQSKEVNAIKTLGQLEGYKTKIKQDLAKYQRILNKQHEFLNIIKNVLIKCDRMETLKKAINEAIQKEENLYSSSSYKLIPEPSQYQDTDEDSPKKFYGLDYGFLD